MLHKTENKICSDCKTNFIIDEGDLNLYEKVGLKIPNKCFDCRMKQYFIFSNFGKFRKGTSDLSGTNFITVLPENARYPIYNSHEWWGDSWDPMNYGQDYNPDRPFFEQLKELQEKVPRPHQIGQNNTNCDWCDDTWGCKNSYLSRSMLDCENLNYGYRCIKIKDSFDIVYSFNLQNSYDCLECYDSFNLSFSQNSRDCIDSYFLFDCRNCQNCFMSWGLRNKQYCIRNQQYTKEEYEKLIPKIIEHMNEMPYVDKKKRIYKYGEFFPTEFSPFAYNETMAQEYLPFTKEEILEWGYSWKNPEAKEHNVTIQPQNLPNHIKDITDDILNQIIGCEHKGKCNENCSVAFRIIPQELEFYRKQNLSFPRLCPNCRHYQRIKQRNPLKLWHRKCTCSGTKSDNGIYQNTAEHFHKPGRCPNEFETSYALERLETVYCEQCYSVEVA